MKIHCAEKLNASLRYEICDSHIVTLIYLPNKTFCTIKKKDNIEKWER